jgi:hypothetical protein
MAALLRLSHLGMKRLWRAGVLLCLGCFIWYLLARDEKHRLSVGMAAQRMCDLYPDTGDIAVSVKTGATEAKRKLPAILNTTLACVNDVMIFSDLNQTYGDIQIHDVLSRFSPTAMQGNKDFDVYRDQLKLQAEGREAEIEGLATRLAYAMDWQTFGHSAAWALDKYKFLHMLEYAYELQPGRDWYLFIESDTYVSWPNLKRWLGTLDATKKLYIGNAIQKSDERHPLYFAHGGSGFVLSGPALKEFAVDRKGIATSLDSRMHTWWAGDFTVADALYDNMGLEVTTAAPMFNAQSPRSLPLWQQSWCEPVLTLHHMNQEDFLEIFRREARLSFSHFLIRDVYAALYPDGFPELWYDWDNAADAHEFGLNGNAPFPWANGNEVITIEPNDSVENCRRACEYNKECFQYTWRNTTVDIINGGFDYLHSCVLASAFRLGEAKAPQEFYQNTYEKDTYRAWHSGWLHERIASWVDAHWECPKGDHWVTNDRTDILKHSG